MDEYALIELDHSAAYRLNHIGAPVFEADGRPVGAILVTGPGERLQDHRRVGAMVLATARGLSRGQAPAVTFGPDRAFG